ncbi:MAG: FKBP-type peptidyl-prolyl cis-trans isomerase [Deltaproteobacteria bacterium]|nr:FKBP-type peptidyl-prolyl cis-trans isomerase [Deltaproteobacteria bacterium]
MRKRHFVIGLLSLLSLGLPVGADPALSRPTITVPRGPRPTALRTRDLRVGTGAVAAAGMQVEVQYVGVAWSTGREFDASWNRGSTFRFTLGNRMVIQGWDQGVAGMRVGGRRELVIPPALGYGARGAGGAIGPNETLIFVVDLVSVR